MVRPHRTDSDRAVILGKDRPLDDPSPRALAQALNLDLAIDRVKITTAAGRVGSLPTVLIVGDRISCLGG